VTLNDLERRNGGILRYFSEFAYIPGVNVHVRYLISWRVLVTFGRPFVKRFTLCYRTAVLCVCPVCLSVTLVYCAQMVGWIKMKLGMKNDEGRSQPLPHGVRWGPSYPSPKKGNIPQFSVHISCGQTAGWIKMPLGREVGLDPRDILLHRDPAPPPQKGGTAAPPLFGPCIVAKWRDGSRSFWYGGRPQPRPHCVR